MTTSFSLSISMQTPAGTIDLPASQGPAGIEFGGGPYRCENGQLIVDRDGLDILYDRIG